MKMLTLGKTGLRVSKTAIGTVPLQRLSFDEAVRLLHRCYDNGVVYYDTSDNYDGTDEKVGAAFGDGRAAVVSTKISPVTYAEAKLSIEHSLRALRREAIDLIQLHNPKRLPNPDAPDDRENSGAYAAALEAKRAGYVRHIGFTSHDIERALEAAQSGLFETIQYPLNFLSNEREERLIALCAKLKLGLIAMKPFAGGVITDPAFSFAFFRRFENVVPIYGIQRDSELDALLALENDPPEENEAFLSRYQAVREQLSKRHCRGCEHCESVCPAGIKIGTAGRLGDFFYRNPPAKYLGDDAWYNRMQKVLNCQNCGACAVKCPFGLDMREPMKRSYDIFMDFWARRGEYTR